MLDDGIVRYYEGVGSLVACNCICLHVVELTDSLNSFEFWTLDFEVALHFESHHISKKSWMQGSKM